MGPIIVVMCIFVWMLLGCCCRKRCKLTADKKKDYTILSIVLMLFLCYPMLVKLTLSMLKCPLVGSTPYLMADLQEPCFQGRHIKYFMFLTIPLLLLYVLGLPLIAALIVLRNREHLHKKHFYTRYGLLYMGYRPGREWWELVIAFRKVTVVSIGTFGTIVNAVDLQAFIALGTVFLSIIVHLIGQPFDRKKENSRRLHNLEFTALTICWLTFWGGLLFFLGQEKPDSIPPAVKMLTTIILVATNCIFLVISAYLFVREYLVDRKMAHVRRQTKIDLALALNSMTQIVPVGGQSGEDNTAVTVAPETIGNTSILPIRSRSTIMKANAIHNEFHLHEEDLRNRTNKRQQRAKRQTQLRVLARSHLKNSKALGNIKQFEHLKTQDIELIIDQMSFRKRFKGDVLVREGDVSDAFYVIVDGNAVDSVNVEVKNQNDENGEVKVDEFGHPIHVDEQGNEIEPKQLPVGHVLKMECFGEGALLATETDQETGELSHRTATVTVSSDTCGLLCLTRSKFLTLRNTEGENMFKMSKKGDGEDEKGGTSVIEGLQMMSNERHSINEEKIKQFKLSVENDFSLHSIVGDGTGVEL